MEATPSRPARGSAGRGAGFSAGRHANRNAADRGAARRAKLQDRIEAGLISVEELTDLAREVLLRILAAAPKSRAELAAALARRGFPEPVVERLLDRFEDVGLINDTEYAGMLVRTRHQERGLARRAIAQELRRRGIDDQVAATALSGVEDTEDEMAQHIARSRLAKTVGLDRETRIRRTVAALARKGYPPALAYEVVQRELAQEPDPEDDQLAGYQR